MAREAASIGALPLVARALLALAVVAAALELVPVVVAWWIGATEWWSEIPSRLPLAARSAAMVALPAAVAWARSARDDRPNGWLWRGALIVALVQVARYPASAAGGVLLERDLDLAGIVQLGLGLVLAGASILGVWALGEGVKDAGGRSPVAVVVALVIAVAFGLLLVIPSLMVGVELGVASIASLLSVALNGLFVFVEALLAGRTAAGVIAGVSPRRAWRAGTIGAAVILAVPLLSFVTLLATSLSQAGGESFSIPFLNVLTCFGWPLLATAIATGMGRIPVSRDGEADRAYLVRGAARFVPAA